MTRQQFRRMTIFALRMVRVAVGTRARRSLRDHVEEVLTRLNDPASDCHWQDLEAWDQRPPNRTGFQSMSLCDWMLEYGMDHGLEREVHKRSGQWDMVQTTVGRGLCCCIRAAFDIAVAQSAGVLGFTAGDLRRMWKGRPLPRWVTSEFTPPLAEAPDSAGILL